MFGKLASTVVLVSTLYPVAVSAGTINSAYFCVSHDSSLVNNGSCSSANNQAYQSNGSQTASTTNAHSTSPYLGVAKTGNQPTLSYRPDVMDYYNGVAGASSPTHFFNVDIIDGGYADFSVGIGEYWSWRANETYEDVTIGLYDIDFDSMGIGIDSVNWTGGQKYTVNGVGDSQDKHCIDLTFGDDWIQLDITQLALNSTSAGLYDTINFRLDTKLLTTVTPPTAAPEPGSLFLMLVGLLMVGMKRASCMPVRV